MELPDAETISRTAALEALTRHERWAAESGAESTANVANIALLGPISWAAFQATDCTCSLEEAAAAAVWAAQERGEQRPSLLSYLDVTQRAIDIVHAWIE
jgi:hypothetical protein